MLNTSSNVKMLYFSDEIVALRQIR